MKRQREQNGAIERMDRVMDGGHGWSDGMKKEAIQEMYGAMN